VKGFPRLAPHTGTAVRLPNFDPSAPVPDLPKDRDLDQLYRAHAATVARWAGHLGGPGADVDDLVHEIFLVVERRLPDFRGEAKVTTWLYGITARVVSERRRKDRFRRWFGRTRRADVERALSPIPLTPVEELERRQAVETVYRILDRLPDKYRAVLILFELEGASGEEIAARLGRKLPTVWVHLHRARGRFLEEMKRETGEGR
jgi:RNA polymerase sigma-70 factor, ECF subfamily